MRRRRPKTVQERSTAKRIRARIADGSASASDEAWLRAYLGEEESAPPTFARPNVPAREPPTTVAPDASGTYVEVDDPTPHVSSAPSSPAAPSQLAPMPAACRIKECPACQGRNKAGPQICATTGEEVWPPLSMSAARLVAGGIFFVIGLAIRIMRGASELHEPTNLQRDNLATAIIEITRRRMGWVAAWDDFLAAGYALSSYTHAAMRAPTEPAKLESGAKRAPIDTNPS